MPLNLPSATNESNTQKNENEILFNRNWLKMVFETSLNHNLVQKIVFLEYSNLPLPLSYDLEKTVSKTIESKF